MASAASQPEQVAVQQAQPTLCALSDLSAGRHFITSITRRLRRVVHGIAFAAGVRVELRRPDGTWEALSLSPNVRIEPVQ